MNDPAQADGNFDKNVYSNTVASYGYETHWESNGISKFYHKAGSAAHQ